MTRIKPAKLTTLKNAAFELGDEATGNEYAAVCSQARMEPAGTATEFVGMTPDATWAGEDEWQLVLAFADDYETADSLWNFLFDNDGTSVPVRFWPDIAGQGFEGVVAIRAAGMGGQARQIAQSTITLKLAGKPTRTAGSYPSGE